VEALFVGEGEGMERDLARRDGVEFAAIQAGALHGVGWRDQLRGALRLARGAAGAYRIVGAFRPDVVLLTGGFVGVPVSVAAWLRRAPSVVYLPDVEPGLALKVMARLATKVATTTDASAAYLPASKMVVTGYPVRAAFAWAGREAARARLGLPPDARVLLIFGGSKGARSINRALMAALPQLLRRSDRRVVHITGQADWAEVSAARAALPAAERDRHLAFPYLHEEMVDALAAADLAVCRSGASALGELPAAGLPAVLVPYPHAWRYQKVNAQYLADRGAALILEDGALNDPERGLLSTVERLLEDSERMRAMRAASRRLARPDGAAAIAQLAIRVGRSRAQDARKP
jgi:UDP-N-acetylglucosamine--N-acetylmuramyl-(pentapeptide) pyrophosphoryl-undecaprenol N-acetylglucosamine transferase